MSLLATEAGPEAKPVSKAEGETLAGDINACGYFETSAKTGEGVTQVMDAAIDAVEERNKGCCGCM